MNAGSPLGFTVEAGLVLEAIVARETAHQRAVRPIVDLKHLWPAVELDPRRRMGTRPDAAPEPEDDGQSAGQDGEEALLRS